MQTKSVNRKRPYHHPGIIAVLGIHFFQPWPKIINANSNMFEPDEEGYMGPEMPDAMLAASATAVSPPSERMFIICFKSCETDLRVSERMANWVPDTTSLFGLICRRLQNAHKHALEHPSWQQERLSLHQKAGL
jgi:hypothetical protein